MKRADLEVRRKLEQLKQKRKSSRNGSTVRYLGAGFFLAILIGSILLSLPICNQKPIAYPDALFTAVSAVCVTGLMTVSPAAQFTVPGKVILLMLIQLGGLGIIAVGMLFFYLINRRRQMTISEQIRISESYGFTQIGGMSGMIRRILIGAFSVEAIGAVLYAPAFIRDFGAAKGIAYSIFHSISAFCNAGIDLLGDSSLTRYVTDPLVNMTTIFLIIVSGLGFIVWFDLDDSIKDAVQKRRSFRKFRRSLKLHTRLVLISTLILIVVGTVLVFILEYNNPATIGTLSFPQKVMASLFQSVTDRTAGFATFSQAGMHDETKLLNCVIMLIGGSPTGTAGGVKTTTMALLLLTIISTVKGNEDTEAYGRRINPTLLRTALSIVGIAFAILMAGTILILTFENDAVPEINVLYETVSALGTVGLSADLTGSLTRASQAVIMVLMYIGRLGPLTIALIFIGRGSRNSKARKLLQEDIMIG